MQTLQSLKSQTPKAAGASLFILQRAWEFWRKWKRACEVGARWYAIQEKVEKKDILFMINKN